MNTPGSGVGGRGWVRRGLRALGWAAALLLCAYVAAGAWAWAPGGGAIRLAIGGLVFAWCFGLGFVRSAGWRAWAGRGAIVLGLVLLALPRPRLDRTWSPDQARLPTVVRETPTRWRIGDVRHAVYATAQRYDVAWEERAIDLDRLDEAWFGVTTFAPGSAIGHVFLSFGFRRDDGGHDHLAASVEIRKEVGERYSPLTALFRRYELAYVLADERDVVGLRVLHHGDDTYLYPVHATPEQLRLVFADVVARAVVLGERPEFYHTLASTCASNLVAHLERHWPGVVPRWDPRVLLPGNADALALERGLIAFDGGIDAARARFRVDPAVARAWAAHPAFSARIRRR